MGKNSSNKWIKVSDLKKALEQLNDEAVVRVIHYDQPDSYMVYDAVEAKANTRDNIVEILF